MRPKGVTTVGPHLREALAQRLAERGLSLRALAREAGISHSALSRTLRGHSRPTPHLLAAVARVLGCSAEALAAEAATPQAAGQPSRDGATGPPAGWPQGAAWPPATGNGAATGTWDALRALGVDPSVDAARVRTQLGRLAEYALTAEARQMVDEGLARKIAALGARGPVIDRLRRLAALYLDDGGAPSAVRAVAGSAVLYFLLAVDDIDDYIFPVGYLDDAVAVSIADAEVRRLQAVGSIAGDAPIGP